MAIKEIEFATDGSITLRSDAPDAPPIVVTPRLLVSEHAAVTYSTTCDAAIGSMANLLADQADQLMNLSKRLAIQESRLGALVELIKSVTAVTHPDTKTEETKVVYGAKLATE